MKGHHFGSTEDIQMAVTQALIGIPQAAFQECYKQWQHRRKRSVNAQWTHFGGDHIVANLLTTNVNYSDRTAPLTSKVAFYIFIQQI